MVDVTDNDGDGRSNQLRQYINHLLIEVRESQRTLIQARYAGEGANEQLRADLQSDILMLYRALRPYRDRAPRMWTEIELYTTENGPVTGVDSIDSWTQLTDEVEADSADFSGKKTTVTQPKILPFHVLDSTASALFDVADEIGFNAVAAPASNNDAEFDYADLLDDATASTGTGGQRVARTDGGEQ